ncbi:XVIPCD domain-containing protein [Lysobacter enzymogenes]|uniref:XVIPCD domain-containing protein n=1 Tax=Lysobacter enzymogenes TaxID=69 RepID=UPI00099D68D4|nr:XVIPCD domain-containing protein [Lysobacter enzymogenes]UZW63078.1 peptidoglycan-binding protein [Lysobacter enzymogenes]
MSELNNRDYLLLRAYESGIREPRELAAFMGQMQVESGNFRSMHENLNYSGERLLEVFPGRNGMDTRAEADAVARGGQQGIANAIYGGNWGRENLGNTEQGDGWRFHGRGYVQLTGRDNYERVQRETGLDVVGNPDLASNRENAANIAVHYWQGRVVARGHQDDVRAATHDINGGYNHLPERRAAVTQWQGMLTPEVMQGLARGEVNLPAQGRANRDPMADGVLKLNERGDAVERMQEQLKQLGYRDARGNELNPDGHFGGRTDEALRQFQRDQGIKDDGIAGPTTLGKLREAVERQQSQQSQQPEQTRGEQTRAPSMADPANRDNPMYNQALEGLAKLGPNGGFRNPEEMQRAAAALTYDASVAGMNKIDHVVRNGDGSGLFAVQGGLSDPSHQRVHVGAQEAVSRSVEQTTQQLAQDKPQQQAAPEQAREQEQAARRVA